MLYLLWKRDVSADTSSGGNIKRVSSSSIRNKCGTKRTPIFTFLAKFKLLETKLKNWSRKLKKELWFLGQDKNCLGSIQQIVAGPSNTELHSAEELLQMELSINIQFLK